MIPIEIVMRDAIPETVNEDNCNNVINLYPTYCTQCVLVINRIGSNDSYFDSFDIGSPPQCFSKKHWSMIR